ncbi:MAG: hypothetical protein JSR59_16760 [Proteobacteria bacterium]|nr:hypothetical protein [Pseudomonadota bacterium]
MATTNDPPWNIADLMRYWFPQGAPSTLVQPILPGWSLNINSNNSAAPQTEIDVLAHHSYGRQLGRISDALRELVLLQGAKPEDDNAYGKFLSMWGEIQKVKAGGVEQRVEQVMADLGTLRQSDAEKYERVASKLRSALK